MCISPFVCLCLCFCCLPLRKEKNTNILGGIYNSRTFTGPGNYETVGDDHLDYNDDLDDEDDNDDEGDDDDDDDNDAGADDDDNAHCSSPCSEGQGWKGHSPERKALPTRIRERRELRHT